MDHDHDHMLHENPFGATTTPSPAMNHNMHGAGGMPHSSVDHSSMDHSFLDHPGMVDHSGMDHSGMDHGSMGHMTMAFHFGCNETVLFDNWKITNVGGLIGSMVGIFIMAALYEGLKYYREYLFWRCYNSMQYRSVTSPDDKSSVGTSDHRIVHVVGEVIRKKRPTMLSWPHAVQTGLHVIQVVISYLLMLIFMTYNVWLCIAVLAGAATGYFLFGWKKSVVVDVTEHCH